MSEKERLLSLPDHASHLQESLKRRQHSRAWLIPATIFAVLLWCSRFALNGHHCHSNGHDVGKRRVYAGEHIEWTLCGNLDGSDLECSSINVPMDQFDEENSGNKTFSIPIARLRGSLNATKNIILNPGGPGGGGVGFLHRKGNAIQKVVGDNFHILSFDPRGVNDSRPQAICYPDSETRKSRSIRLSYDPTQDGSQLYPWIGNHVQACAETMGEYGRYMNTPQTAADMNSILDAVGQEKMVYWGFSYGSLLGQTYATMFPNRSERVIIDGVVNQFYWYNDPVEGDFEDSDKVLDGFFDECVKAEGRCPLYPFGNKKETLKENVTTFIRSLKDDPKPVYINNTAHGLVDHNAMWLNAIFHSLYRPSSWYTLADILSQLMRGNGTAALLSFVLDDDMSLFMEHGQVIHSNDGAAGKAYWPEEKEKVLEMLQPMWNSSSFAVTQMEEVLTKSRWIVPRTHSFVPRRGVKTLHPLLVLSTTYDPICPIGSARIARDSFIDSRLIEIKGYGHCSTAMPSSCLVPHVRAFLNNGTLPKEDIECEVDGPYFVKPEEQKAKLSGGMESEEDRIRAAQHEMASAAGWAPWL